VDCRLEFQHRKEESCLSFFTCMLTHKHITYKPISSPTTHTVLTSGAMGKVWSQPRLQKGPDGNGPHQLHPEPSPSLEVGQKCFIISNKAGAAPAPQEDSNLAQMSEADVRQITPPASVGRSALLPHADSSCWWGRLVASLSLSVHVRILWMCTSAVLWKEHLGRNKEA
jgi:hypothetical protein